MIKGRLKSWNEEKGFGFISSETLELDVFVHISALKTMSRKPQVGDIIYFNTEQQADGKIRAINCEIEGVASVQKHQSANHRKYKNQSKTKFPLVTLVLIGAIGVFVYDNWGSFLSYLPSSSHEYFKALGPDLIENQSVNFVCDGRKYCSQMTSRAEAVFFINNCPDTRMDGDRDGRPCENDSRF